MTTLENICNPMPFALAAWNNLLKEAGHTVWTVAAFDEPPPGSEKKSPFLETQITNLRASGIEHPVGDGVWASSVWAAWDAELITRASTMRGKNGNKHVDLVGAIYVLAARTRKVIAPYHVLQHFRPSGLTSSTDGLLDQSEIHFDIKITVRDDAWSDA